MPKILKVLALATKIRSHPIPPDNAIDKLSITALLFICRFLDRRGFIDSYMDDDREASGK
jgi:hypothetical protein